MPGWDRVLSDDQIRAVAAYARSFAPRSSEITVPLPVPDQAVPSSPQSEGRGRAAFLLLGCWACHGLEARGDGPGTASPLIRPADFTRGDFRSGGTPFDLYRTVLTGMAGVPMPAFGRNLVLTRESASALDELRNKLLPHELKDVEAFIGTLSTSEEWNALADGDQESASNGWRWNLVHYIQAVGGRRSGLLRYLFDDPYLTH
jgi:mono/diheme cytochrome c family protein